MRNHYLGLLAVPLLLAGCNSDSGDTGTVDLAVTDAPIDEATAVVVQFDAVELKPADGASRTITFDEPRHIDLYQLQNGETEYLLEEVTVDAGRYNWIRLHVTANDDGVPDSYINLETGGENIPLYIPSGFETGLKLVSGFYVPADGHIALTVDFNLRKSVHSDGTGETFMLKPALRLLNSREAGTVTGTVLNTYEPAGDGVNVADATCQPVVYAYQGAGVTPDDYGSATEPYSSAMLQLDEETGNYGYTLAFLEPGDYTVAVTCQLPDEEGDGDNPAVDEDIVFGAGQDVTLAAGATVTADDF